MGKAGPPENFLYKDVAPRPWLANPILRSLQALFDDNPISEAPPIMWDFPVCHLETTKCLQEHEVTNTPTRCWWILSHDYFSPRFLKLLKFSMVQTSCSKDNFMTPWGRRYLILSSN